MSNIKHIGDSISVNVDHIISVHYAGGKPQEPPTPIVINIDMGEWAQSLQVDSTKFDMAEVRRILFGEPPPPKHPVYDKPRVIKDIPQA